MTYNSSIHHRRSIRLKGYDYSGDGLYFLTICTQDRTKLFGEVVNGDMVLNEAGRKADQCWLEIPEHFKNVILHDFVVMPNHVHGVIELIQENTGASVGAKYFSPNELEQDYNVGAKNILPNEIEQDNNVGAKNRAKNISPLHGTSKTVGSVVRGFKVGVTKWMRYGDDGLNVGAKNILPVQNKEDGDGAGAKNRAKNISPLRIDDGAIVWQRNYYEHIIRNDLSYGTIAEYIINNPAKWQEDKFYVI